MEEIGHMIAKMVLGGLFAIGLVGSAQAAMSVTPLSGGTPVIRVAEGCGPGYWRGPHGHCHPFAVNRACPRGYHLGPEGRRCWPN